VVTGGATEDQVPDLSPNQPLVNCLPNPFMIGAYPTYNITSTIDDIGTKSALHLMSDGKERVLCKHLIM
jgi:hypothetical protein